MPNAETLRQLHRLHIQLSDLRDRLARGPRQVAVHEQNVARCEAEVSRIRDEAKAARVQVDQRQLQLKSGESKIADLKAKLNAANSNREYQALKDQIAADEMAGSVLADEILEGLERLDEYEKQIAEAKGQTAKAAEELKRNKDEVLSKQESLLADAQRVENELKAAESQLPDDFREAYSRAVKGRGADAMASVEGEHCQGCNQKVTPNRMNELLLNRIVACTSCGRLLYLPEDRSVGGRG